MSFRIRKLASRQIFVASFVGALSGVYIYKPIFEQIESQRKEAEEEKANKNIPESQRKEKSDKNIPAEKADKNIPECQRKEAEKEKTDKNILASKEKSKGSLKDP